MNTFLKGVKFFFMGAGIVFVFWCLGIGFGTVIGNGLTYWQDRQETAQNQVKEDNDRIYAIADRQVERELSGWMHTVNADGSITYWQRTKFSSNEDSYTAPDPEKVNEEILAHRQREVDKALGEISNEKLSGQ